MVEKLGIMMVIWKLFEEFIFIKYDIQEKNCFLRISSILISG